MSTLSDVQALYGSARNVWAKSQAHVIAHLVLAGVVFGVCQASIPELPVARFDLKQITENEWFKLSKDVGIVYASFVIPVIVVAVYSAALRVGGQFLVAVVMVISATSSRPKQSRLLYSSVLEPIALTLGKADFELADLRIKASDLALKYQSKKDVRWDAYQQSLSALTKNAQIYLGDFLLFLLLWITLFKLMPQAPWVQMNGTLFYPVAVILAGLALFAWFRVSRAIAVIPDLLLMSVSEMIRTDPDMTALLEVPKEKLAEVREKIGQLLRKEWDRVDSRPSLFAFLRYQFGFRPTATKREIEQNRGWPFPSLYEKGDNFSWNKKLKENYENAWLAGYLAYLYYRLHIRLTQLARAFWQIARYIVIGTP